GAPGGLVGRDAVLSGRLALRRARSAALQARADDGLGPRAGVRRVGLRRLRRPRSPHRLRRRPTAARVARRRGARVRRPVGTPHRGRRAAAGRLSRGGGGARGEHPRRRADHGCVARGRRDGGATRPRHRAVEPGAGPALRRRPAAPHHHDGLLMPDPRAPETASPVPSFDLADVGRARTLVERRLAAAGIASPAAEALVLLEAATGLDRRVVLLQPDRPLDAAARARLAHLLHRRVAREPLQHVIGTAPFYGLDLVVSPAVLVPRPETERLVERVLAELPPSPDGLVLDVGCGSGAIALALKAERAALEVWGSDVSAEALAVARENGRRLGLEVTWRRSDLLADADVAAAAARCL